MSVYRRNYVLGGTYFFTVNLLDRNSTLLVDYIDTLRTAVAEVKQRQPFLIDAWVVLPEHMHAVWTLPENDADYSGRWREIKKAFNRRIPPRELLSPARQKQKERGIWQRRFWEHTIRSDADYRHHVDYVHLNPLKHRLVKQVKDWPHSSFHHHVKKGTYPESWCGNTL
ncbi:MAG TPA: transposase [Cellvibrionaceae bacterium]|nr:transposase [Cellvibrionaceae bacterium]HMY39689.1 transposase [Marinagarivorans sp.]HNG59238.1 transposase [Cellvibrionaceae bacterium]